MNLEASEIVVIILSVVFPFMLKQIEEWERKIDEHLFIIFGYVSKEKLAEGDNYFDFLKLITAGAEGKVKFFAEIPLQDNSPLLLPGRSGGENEVLRNSQVQIKRLVKWIEILKGGQILMVAAIIVLLLLSP